MQGGAANSLLSLVRSPHGCGLSRPNLEFHNALERGPEPVGK
jgi:hypothetical protein